MKEAFQAVDGGATLFEELDKGRFRYNSGMPKIVCTMIKKSATEWKFLYKSQPDTSGHAFNMCVLNDTNSTRELLYVLAALTNPDHWGAPK